MKDLKEKEKLHNILKKLSEEDYKFVKSYFNKLKITILKEQWQK